MYINLLKFQLSILGNDYFNSGEDEFGFDDVEAHETTIPIDKIEQYILSENSYTRFVGNYTFC